MNLRADQPALRPAFVGAFVVGPSPTNPARVRVRRHAAGSGPCCVDVRPAAVSSVSPLADLSPGDAVMVATPGGEEPATAREGGAVPRAVSVSQGVDTMHFLWCLLAFPHPSSTQVAGVAAATLVLKAASGRVFRAPAYAVRRVARADGGADAGLLALLLARVPASHAVEAPSERAWLERLVLAKARG